MQALSRAGSDTPACDDVATAAAPASDACTSLRKEERSRLGSPDPIVVPSGSDIVVG